MKFLKMMTILGVLCSSLFVAQGYALENNAKAPDLSLKDPMGETHKLSDHASKYVVLEWVNYDCPFVRKHYDSGNMQKLQKWFTDQGVVWFSINSSAPGKQGNFDAAEIKKRMEEYGAHPTAYLIDEDGTVGARYGAQTTPHMFLIAPNGDLLYQGAIDSMASFDQKDIPIAENYLKKAFNEAKAGNIVSIPMTKSYGCSVKY